MSPDNQESFWTIQCELALSSSQTQSKLWKEIKYKFGFGLVYITMQTEFRNGIFSPKYKSKNQLSAGRGQSRNT